MIMIFTTGVGESLKQLVLQVLCYPCGMVLHEVAWGLNRVPDDMRAHPESLNGQTAVIVFVDYYEDDKVDYYDRNLRNGPPRREFLPFRMVTIEKARIFAGKLLLDLRLAEFVYYSDVVKQGYRREHPAAVLSPPLPPELDWNSEIGKQQDAPKPVLQDGATRMVYRVPRSWKTEGNMVMRYGGPELRLLPLPRDSKKVRAENSDWQSVVDKAAGCTQLNQKLFYQIDVFRSGTDEPHTPVDDLETQLFNLRSGEHLDLFVHFYYGTRRPVSRRQLEVVSDSAYLAIIGNALLDVYPDQPTGTVERLRVIAKRQLTDDVTRLRVQERRLPATATDTAAEPQPPASPPMPYDSPPWLSPAVPPDPSASNPSDPGTPALATVELYFRITPRRLYVWGVLLLFALGSFLNAVPEDFGPPELQFSWGWKVIGSLMMAGAFWIGFAKLPSKG